MKLQELQQTFDEMTHQLKELVEAIKVLKEKAWKYDDLCK